jgi:S-formylglutathione hydrolase FrmB
MKKVFTLTIIVLIGMSASGQTFMKLDASFYSSALDTVKKVDIYLPGEYYVNSEIEYPVIYFLHGAGGNENTGMTRAMTYYQSHYGDSSITSPAAVIVCPDGSCEPYLGCMWLNSELYGNYEDFIIHDLIDFVESNFRVMADKNFRFIHGQSMGGFGSAYLSCKHPHLFRACCPSAGAFSFPDTLIYDWRDAVYEENNGFYLDYNAGSRTQLLFTTSGGFAPNLEVEPWHIECIYDTLGNVVDSVRDKWDMYNSCQMIKDLSEQHEMSFFLICGREDEFIFYPSNLEFVDSLEKYDMDYDYAWHDYGHTVYDPVSHTIMFKWLDSLIAESYIHLGVEEEFQNSKIPKFKISVYPNPAAKEITVQYIVENSGPVEVVILNQLGQEEWRSMKQERTAGLHQNSIDVSGLRSGLYFIRLTTSNASTTARFIKY